LTQREREVLGRVGSDAERFPDNGDPTGATGCCQGMLMREFRVFVDQIRRHGKVPCDFFRVLLAEGLQLVPCRGVQVATSDLVGDQRIVRARTLIGCLNRSSTINAAPLRVRTLATLTGRARVPVTGEAFPPRTRVAITTEPALAT